MRRKNFAYSLSQIMRTYFTPVNCGSHSTYLFFPSFCSPLWLKPFVRSSKLAVCINFKYCLHFENIYHRLQIFSLLSSWKLAWKVLLSEPCKQHKLKLFTLLNHSAITINGPRFKRASLITSRVWSRVGRAPTDFGLRLPLFVSNNFLWASLVLLMQTMIHLLKSNNRSS